MRPIPGDVMQTLVRDGHTKRSTSDLDDATWHRKPRRQTTYPSRRLNSRVTRSKRSPSAPARTITASAIGT
jgi:hypothetical protein